MSNNDDWGQPQQPQQPQPQTQQPVQQQPTNDWQQPGAPGQLQKVRHKLENEDIIAMVASFFLPGLGQILLGQTKKGATILAAMILTCGAGYIVTLLVVADAYFVAQCKKDRPVDDWEIFPDYNRYM